MMINNDGDDYLWNREEIITGNWAACVGKGSRRQDELADMVWYSVMKDFVNHNRWFERNHSSNKPVRDIVSK